jgi:hypothetical protein
MRSIVLIALLALLVILGRMTDDETVFPYVKAGILAIAIRWGYAISNAVAAHFALKAKEELAQRLMLAEQEKYREALSQQFSEDKKAAQKTAQATLSSLQSSKAVTR